MPGSHILLFHNITCVITELRPLYQCNGEQLTQQTNKCHKQTNIVGEVHNYAAMQKQRQQTIKRVIVEDYLQCVPTSLDFCVGIIVAVTFYISFNLSEKLSKHRSRRLLVEDF